MSRVDSSIGSTPTWRRRRPSLALGGLAVAFWAAGVATQIASAMVERPESLVLLTIGLLSAAAWCFTARAAGVGSAIAALVVAVTIGFLAEWVGTTTGFPFGDYVYTGTLTPAVATVPVVVPLAWFAMGVPAYAVGSAIVSAVRPGGAVAVVGRAVVGAVALTAWDLFLDPQMVGLGYWRWAEQGPYRGIPVSNYLGWLVVSFLLMLVLDTLLRRRLAHERCPRGLLGLYTSMAVVETVGFLGPLRLDPFVAAVGGVAMGALAVSAWLAVRRG